MVPDAHQRLRSVLKALDEVIAPAIPDDAALAREQVALARKSIALAMEQMPLEFAFLVRDAREDIAFASQLCEAGSGLEELEELRAISDATQAALPASIPDRETVGAARNRLKHALERAVARAYREGDPRRRAEITRLVLAYSERRNVRERAWVAATGFDPAPGDLPDLAAAVMDGRTAP